MSRNADYDDISRQFESRYALMLAIAQRYAPRDLIFDIVQQVFIDLVDYASTGKVDSTADMTPLLARMTRFRAIKFANEKKRSFSPILQEVAEQLADRTSGESLDQEAEMHQERLNRLQNCMEKLSPENQRLVREHYFRKRSMKEIAEASGQNPSTLVSRFFRIRVALKNCIEKFRNP